MEKHNRKSQQFYVFTYGKVLAPLKVGETMDKSKNSTKPENNTDC